MATRSSEVLRMTFFHIQRMWTGTSAGPSRSWAWRRPASSTGTGSMATPYRSAIAGSWVQATYAFGET